MNIKEFNKGDIITRIEPNKLSDDSFIGDKCVLIGISNRCIYIKDLSFIGHENRIISLLLIRYFDGWEYYEEINDIDNLFIFKNNFKRIIKDELKKENYMFINELKNILEDITQKQE